MGTRLSDPDVASAVCDCWDKSFNLLSNMGALKLPELSNQDALKTNFGIRTGHL